MWSLQGLGLDLLSLTCCSLWCWWSFCADPQLHVPVLVRWQLMHRWPGVSAQFEHLWGQRIGILSMYDSRANGLMRLLGMKLPSPGWCVHLHRVAVEVLSSRVSNGLPFSELERGGHPEMSVCDALFVSLQCLCVWLALHVGDGSLLGLCVFKPHLCHQASVL